MAVCQTYLQFIKQVLLKVRIAFCYFPYEISTSHGIVNIFFSDYDRSQIKINIVIYSKHFDIICKIISANSLNYYEKVEKASIFHSARFYNHKLCI